MATISIPNVGPSTPKLTRHCVATGGVPTMHPYLKLPTTVTTAPRPTTRMPTVRRLSGMAS